MPRRTAIGDKRQRVAVTGIGVLSPNGIGRAAFREAIRSGRSGVREIDWFATDQIPCHIAGRVPPFDEKKYVKKKDLRHLSRAALLAIVAAEEAIEDAALSKRIVTLSDRRGVGVFVGTGGGGLAFLEEQYRLYFGGHPKAASVYAIPTATIGSLSSEISIRFGFRGPSHVISTGCTSSTDAIGYAFRELQAGRLNIAVTGGVDAPIAPGILTGFCQMKVLTTSWNDEPTRASRPFDRHRDGFVLGEGAWFLVLEPLHQAIAREIPVYGEIAGYAATCDAHHRVRLHDSGEEPARVMELSLNDAGVEKESVDYIHLHGTSTQLNDRVETSAFKRCFGDLAYTIPASSVKSMIGHPQGASGAAGLVATVLAMQGGFLPPTINLDTPDPACDLDYLPNQSRPGQMDVALCNCIGFGSKNAALTVRRVENQS